MATTPMTTTQLSNFVQTKIMPGTIEQLTGKMDVLKDLTTVVSETEIRQKGNKLKFRILPTFTAATRVDFTADYDFQTPTDTYKEITMSTEYVVPFALDTFIQSFADPDTASGLLANALKALRVKLCQAAFTKLATFSANVGTYGINPDKYILKSAVKTMFDAYFDETDLVQYLGSGDWDALTADSSLPESIRAGAVTSNQIPMLNGVPLKRSQYVASSSQTVDGASQTCYQNVLFSKSNCLIAAARPADLINQRNINLIDTETGIPIQIVEGSDIKNGANYSYVRTFVEFDFLRTAGGVLVKGGVV